MRDEKVKAQNSISGRVSSAHKNLEFEAGGGLQNPCILTTYQVNNSKIFSSLILHPSNPLPNFSPISPHCFHTKAVVFQVREI
jgi:hypothetical protein